MNEFVGMHNKQNKCSIDYCVYYTKVEIYRTNVFVKMTNGTNVLVKLHKLIEQMFVNSEYCRKYIIGFVHIDCGKLCGNVDNFCQDGILNKI